VTARSDSQGDHPAIGKCTRWAFGRAKLKPTKTPKAPRPKTCFFPRRLMSALVAILRTISENDVISRASLQGQPAAAGGGLSEGELWPPGRRQLPRHDLRRVSGGAQPGCHDGISFQKVRSLSWAFSLILCVVVRPNILIVVEHLRFQGRHSSPNELLQALSVVATMSHPSESTFTSYRLILLLPLKCSS
jgi:hypothetical protein